MPSSGVVLGIVDVTEQFGASLVEEASGLIVADGVGDVIELSEGDAGFEVGFGIREGLELLVWGHHLFVAIAFTKAALVIDFLGGKEAWSMEVEVRGEDVLSEVIDLLSEAAGDMGVAEVFAHDGAVF